MTEAEQQALDEERRRYRAIRAKLLKLAERYPHLLEIPLVKGPQAGP